MLSRWLVAAVLVGGAACSGGGPPEIDGLADQVATVGMELQVELDGSDPDGDELVINVDSIFQDEAVDAPDSGNTAPDGRGVGTNTAEVRAERVGDGNGRVYHIGFTATDELGLTCSGEVTVGVPTSRNGTAVDEGPHFDSTVAG